MPETMPVSRHPLPAVFGRAYPYRGMIWKPDMLKEGAKSIPTLCSAAWGKPAVRRLARAIRQDTPRRRGGWRPRRPGRPAPEAKANFHVRERIIGA